jgi:hypothetical protein
MGTFVVQKPRDPAANDAYRAYLISRSQSPIVTHSRKMQLKRLRVLARQAIRQISVGCKIIHRAIVAAKTRRIRRELMLHQFPQQPMILGDKWDF